MPPGFGDLWTKNASEGLSEAESGREQGGGGLPIRPEGPQIGSGRERCVGPRTSPSAHSGPRNGSVPGRMIGLDASALLTLPGGGAWT